MSDWSVGSVVAGILAVWFGLNAILVALMWWATRSRSLPKEKP